MKLKIYKPQNNYLKMNKNVITLCIVLLITMSFFGQNVTFNDTEFESSVVKYSGADTDNNGRISITEAANLTGTLNVSGIGITDLTGIEHFTSITGLDVSNNSLTYSTFDISHNSALTFLDCSDNNLDELNVSTNPNLLTLICNYNTLTILNLNYNPNLEYLDCRYNKITILSLNNFNNLTEIACSNNNITSLNLAALPNLAVLECDNNEISSLNLTGLSALTNLKCNNNLITNIPFDQFPVLDDLDCSYNLIQTLNTPYNITKINCANNNLTTLNLSTLLESLDCANNNLTTLNTNFSPYLTSLICNNNELTNLNLHTTSNSLTELNCSENNLANLDLSNQENLRLLSCSQNQLISLSLQFCPNLYRVNCDDNLLQYLNLTNSTNENLRVNLMGNSTLGCVMIDDLAYANSQHVAGYYLKDETTYFGENCYVYVPDDNFEQALVDLNLDYGTLNDYVETSAINLLETLIVSNKGITDLTGIEKFESLKNLDCSFNALTNVEFNQNINLEYLYCFNNQIEALDLGSNTALKELLCQNNQLTSLNLNNNTSLTSVACNQNMIDNLSINDCESLTSLNCSDNQLNTLNVNYNIGLLGLDCSRNNLTNLTTLYNRALQVLRATDNQLTNLYLDNNTLLLDLWLSNNLLSNLNVSSNTSLYRLLCDNNNLSDIDLSNNPDLVALRCSNNNLSNIDLSNNTSLTDLDLENNNLTTLNLSNNSNLTSIYSSSNSLNSLNIANGNNNNLVTLVIDENPSLTCVKVDNMSITDDWNANINLPATFLKDSQTFFGIDCSIIEVVEVEVKVFLQGPYNSGELSDNLRATGSIPTTSPYIDALTCDASVFITTGSNAIVDWVWIEIRAIDKTTVVASRSALIQSDGDVVGVDGALPVVIDVADGNYYFMISHRNHLGVITENQINLSRGNMFILDLTTSYNLVAGGVNGIADMGDGNYALFSGDFNGDGQIQNSDLIEVQSLIGSNGFLNEDIDMNSQVQNIDIQNKLAPNIGKGQQFSRRASNLKLFAKTITKKL